MRTIWQDLIIFSVVVGFFSLFCSGKYLKDDNNCLNVERLKKVLNELQGKEQELPKKVLKEGQKNHQNSLSEWER